MIDESRFLWIGNDKTDGPEAALTQLQEVAVKKLGESFADMFPQIALYFPKMSNVLSQSWSRPQLGLKRTLRGNWIAKIIMCKENQTCYFSLQPNDSDGVSEGESFEEYYRPLPRFWMELYREVESFVVTGGTVPEFHYWNTPFRADARLDLDDYSEGSGASKSQVKAFAKKVGCRYDALRCWLLTENEDALFLDEEHCDHKVYHVRGKKLDDIYVLPDAQKTLDAYFSHFLSGGKPADFDFRAPVT
jgi:hypothetical protein